MLYWIDILEKRINIFDLAEDKNQIIQLDKMIKTLYCLEKGEINNKKTIISFAVDEGVPDGMTVDAGGVFRYRVGVKV
jgi:sugar lactone lactonase YvrE